METHDPLTRLPNRFHFIELLETALEAAGPSQDLSVLFIDLDRFKHINAALGLCAGDELLRAVARRLKNALAEGDIAGRLGGDEFGILTSRSPERYLEALQAPYDLRGHQWFVTASIGVALYPAHGQTAEELLRCADLAMCQAQDNGGDGLQLFLGQDADEGLERLTLENALRRALDQDELDLLYQPVVTSGGAVAGLEALLSWRHPIHGSISPRRFIPVAEETGMIVPIGTWVIQQACRQGADWRGRGFENARVSVNVSARQFERCDFVESVADALCASELPPDGLELELTESYLMRNPQEPMRRMRQLRELGIRIAIDDFGTGYSSLSSLSRLPLDALKIDQSFVRSLLAPDGSLPVVESIVRLAHSMRLEVVAEGVETAAELEMVRLLGCDMVQGHIYGPALARNAASDLLARNEALQPV